MPENKLHEVRGRTAIRDITPNHAESHLSFADVSIGTKVMDCIDNFDRSKRLGIHSSNGRNDAYQFQPLTNTPFIDITIVTFY
ncbi:MAG: hypothetical protein WBI14_08390 [Anaerolineaceae bacterium]